MSDREKGVECPRCECPLSRVVKTTRVLGHIRRRRACDHCGHRFQTMERAIGRKRRPGGEPPPK